MNIRALFNPLRFSRQGNSVMRGISLILLTSALLFLLPSSARATHIVGGELTYRCLGNNQYELTLIVYRDCFFGDPAAYFDSIAYIGVFDGANSLVDTLQMPFMMVDDTLSPQLNDPCLFVPEVVCVHTTMYRDTVFLDPALAKGGYTLAYQRCCRNQTIVNIFDPVETGATFTAFISPEALAECNNGAVFKDWPPIFICVNQPLIFDHSAEDADGDSLVYRLCTPFKGGTLNDGQPTPPTNPPYDTVDWVSPPFNLNNLLGGVPLTIDPQTGLMTATPNIIGQFVVGVCVDEYRDGQLISTTRRDFQYNVGVCGTVTAAFTGPAEQCGDLEVSFQNQSTNASTYQWSFLLDTTVVGTSTEENPTFTFPDTGLYTVQLVSTVVGNCSDTFATQVHLFDDGVEAAFDIQVVECGDSAIVEGFDLSLDPNNNITSYTWEIRNGFTSTVITGPNPTFVIPAFELEYEMTLTVTTVNGCSDTETFFFDLKPFGPPDLLNDTLQICLGESVELNPLFDEDYIYAWSPANSLSDVNAPNPTASPSQDQVYSLLITDSTGACQIERTVTVLVQNPTLSFEPQYSCDGFTVTFDNQSQDVDAFRWDFGLPGMMADTSTEISPTFTYPDTGTYLVTLRSLAGFPCAQADTLQVEVQVGIPAVAAAFEGSYVDCNTDSVSVQILDQSTVNRGNITDWTWVIAGDTFPGQNPPVLVLTQSDTLPVSLQVTTDEGCVDSLQLEYPILLIDDSGLEDTLLSCAGEPVALFPGADTSYAYQWSPTGGLSDATAPNPTAAPDTATTYTVTITAIGLDTCTVLRTVTVLPSDPPTLSVPADTVTCASSINLSVQSPQAAQILWTNAQGDTLGFGDSLTLSPIGAETYLVTAFDSIGCPATDSFQVTSNGVNVDFPDPYFLCIDSVDQLVIQNNDPNDTLTFSWMPQDLIVGDSATGMPLIAVDSAGVFPLAFTAVNQIGCSQSDSLTLVIADTTFGSGDVNVTQCQPLTLDFTFPSSFGEYYLWDFGDTTNPGPNASGGVVSYTYPDTGSYTVAVYLPSSTCTDTIFLDVFVAPGPYVVADFGFDFTNCEPGAIEITFSDSSFQVQSPIQSWTWWLSSGDTLMEQNPVVAVADGQELEVTLIVLADGGCTDTARQTIVIDSLPEMLQPDTLTSCAGVPVMLNPGGDTSWTYLWSPPDGLSDTSAVNPTALPSMPQHYFAELLVPLGSDDCALQDSVFVDLDSVPSLEILGDTLICEESTVLVAQTGMSLTVLWLSPAGDTLGMGDSLVVEPENESVYIAQVSSGAGCFAADTITVFGRKVDLALMPSDTFACPGDPVSLSALNLDAADTLSYLWSPDSLLLGANDQESVMVNTDNPGSYQISVQAVNQFGCADTATATVLVSSDSLGLDFSFEQSCEDYSVQFTNESPDGVTVEWDFGDGSPVTNEENPLHAYPGPGVYTVLLVAGGGTGCADTLSREITVLDTLLQAAFEVEYTECSDSVLTVQFSDASQVSPDLMISYQWLFSNGATPTDPTVTLSFTQPISLEVDFFITTQTGCMDTVSQVLDLAPLPAFDLPDTVIVCDQGSAALNPDGPADLEYLWMPATGLSDSTAANPVASPDSTTTYTVRIRSIGVDTCERFDSVTVFLPPPLMIDLPGDTTTCADSVSLTAVSAQATGYVWLNAQQQVLGTGPEITLSAGDSLRYELLASDNFGCTLTDTIYLSSQSVQFAAPASVPACLGDTAQIPLSNLDPQDSLSFTFSPSGLPLTLLGDSLVLLPSDTMGDIQLIINTENQFGCTQEDTIAVTFLDTADLSGTLFYAQCEGLTVNFLSTHPLAEFVTWYFGNPVQPNANATGAQVSHIYPGVGIYEAFAVLGGPESCSDTIFLDVEVGSPPFFDYDFEWEYLSCDSPATISLQDLSTHFQDSVIGWEWTFSNGDTATGPNPVLQIDSAQQLEFTLVLTTLLGCEGMYEDELTVQSVSLDFPDSLGVCPGESVFLNPGGSPVYQYLWSPGGSLNDSTATNPLASPDISTLYEVEILAILTGDTCAFQEEVFVAVQPELNYQRTGDLIFCEPQGATLEVEPALPAAIVWSDQPDFSNVLGTADTLAVVTGRPNIYYVQLTDSSGCSYQDTIEVANYQPLVALLPRVELCAGDTLELSAQSLFVDDTLMYFWEPIDDILSGADGPNPLVAPEENTVYTVEFINQFGCVNFDSITIDVLAGIDDITVSATPDTIGIGGASQLEVTFDSDYTYSWTPTGSLDQIDINDPVAGPQITTTYTVEVTTDDGCAATRTVTVTVLDRPCDEPFIFVPQAFTPNDDGENDIFYVYGNPIDEMELIIYNRWGEQVFRSTSKDEGWDGTYQGQLQTPDVYGYYLRARCFNGEEYVKKGNVTLIR